MTKPIDNPDMITALVLTRGRPDGFFSMLSSLSGRARRKDLIDVWVYADDDDPTAPPLVDFDYLGTFGFAVHVLIRPRPMTLGNADNELWKEATSNAGIYFLCPDDYLMETQDWDELIRQGLSTFPDRIALGQITDPLLPDKLLIMAVTAEWANTVGYVMPPYFPFWFNDRWLEELCELVQRRVKLGVEMKMQDGKGGTLRMHNLPFWHAFYRETMCERVEAAERLRRQFLAPGTVEYERSLAEAQVTQARLMAENSRLTHDQLVRIEEGNRPPNGDAPGLLYMKAELLARAHLHWLEGQGIIGTAARTQ